MNRNLLKVISLFVMLLCYGAAFSQQQKVDSLQHLIKKRSGIKKYETIITLVKLLGARGRNREILDFIHDARKIAFEKGDTPRIVQSSRILGQVYNRLSMNNDAGRVLIQTLPIARRNNLREDYGKILNNLAVVYIYRANYDIALDYNLKALRIREEDNDLVNTAVSLWDMGIVYYKLKDYKKGLSYFEKSLELKRQINDLEFIDQLFANIGLCYAYIKDFVTAKLYVDSAFATYRMNPIHIETLINATYCSGVISFGLNELGEAEKHFLTSYGLSKEHNHERFQLDNIEYLSQVYIQRNQINTAIHYLKTAERLIEKGAPFNRELIEIYSRFSQIYNLTREFEKAVFYQQKYIQLKDSLHSEELTNNLMRLEAGFQERENRDKILTQEQILGLQERIILQQTASNIIFGCIAIVLVLVAALLYRRNFQYRVINKILDVKVEERTRELEKDKQALLSAKVEKDELVENSHQEINKALASIKAVCHDGLQKTSDPIGREYLLKIDLTTEQMQFKLKNLQPLQGSRI